MAKAAKMAAVAPSSQVSESAPSAVGRSRITTPRKPKAVASPRFHSSRSPRNNAASTSMNNGRVKLIDTAVAKGRLVRP